MSQGEQRRLDKDFNRWLFMDVLLHPKHILQLYEINNGRRILGTHYRNFSKLGIYYLCNYIMFLLLQSRVAIVSQQSATF